MTLYFNYNSLTSDDYPEEFNTLVLKTKPSKYLLSLTLKSGIDTLPLYYVHSWSIYLCDSANNLSKLELTEDTSSTGISFYVSLPDLHKTTPKSLIVVAHTEDEVIRQEFLDINFKTVKVLKRSLVVNKDITPLSEPNFLIEKSKVTMQTWSAAFQKDVSNYTKLVEPYYKVINNCYQKTSGLLKKNLEGYSTYSVSERPLKVMSDDIQYLQYNNVLNSNYKDLSIGTSSTSTLNPSYYTPTLPFKSINYSDTFKVYLKKNTKNSQTTISIKGVSTNGKIVSETLVLYNSLYRETINKYSTVLSIVSDVSLEITNYIDCSKVHNFLTPLSTPSPVFIDKTYNFNYYQPNYILERSSEGTHSVLRVKNDFNNNTKYSYNFDTVTVDSLYIDENLNMTWTSGGVLYTSNLSIDFTKKLTSVGDNLNKYIYTEDEACLGDWVDVFIDINKLYKDTSINHIVLTVQHGQDLYYLNSSTGTLQPDKYLINCETVKEITKLTIRVTDTTPYIFRLIGDKVCHTATVAPNIIKPKTSTNITVEDTLTIVNGSLMIATQDSPIITHNMEGTYLTFTWEHQDDLDTYIEVGGYKIGNSTRELDSSFIAQIVEDGFSSSECYSLDITKLSKTFFGDGDVLLKVRGSWSTSGNVINSQATALLTVVAGSNQEQVVLTPKYTDLYEYSITISKTGSITITPIIGY